jgi:hypothetical protein
MAKKPLLKPGTLTPESALYDEINRRGNPTGEQVTSTKDHPLPPTGKAGRAWREAEAAKHKGGRK